MFLKLFFSLSTFLTSNSFLTSDHNIKARDYFPIYERDMESTGIIRKMNHIGIIGGGLAGLSTAYHILKKTHPSVPRITIIDKNVPGKGGASSVAGG